MRIAQFLQVVPSACATSSNVPGIRRVPCLLPPQDAVVLSHDGTVAPLHLARNSDQPPGPRYSHAMVSVPAGDKGGGNGSLELAFLFGGCRGDGTRAAEEEAFVLDLASGGAAGGGGGTGGDDEKADDEGADGDDAQVGLNRQRPNARARARARPSVSTFGANADSIYVVLEELRNTSHTRPRCQSPPPLLLCALVAVCKVVLRNI